MNEKKLKLKLNLENNKIYESFKIKNYNSWKWIWRQY